jgi:DNA-directed RNA polymerase sigma subunit (sigma70/sigma32)
MQTDENRTRKIIELREQGRTYKEIGKIFGVTLERIRQLYFREMWRREHKKEDK